MYTLRLKHHFDSAHHIKNYEGACGNVHGHRWIVEIEIKSNKLSNKLRNDMVVDFKDIKKVIDELDHTDLNKKLSINPTAENIAKYLSERIYEHVPDGSIVRVTIWESPEGSITYEN